MKRDTSINLATATPEELRAAGYTFKKIGNRFTRTDAYFPTPFTGKAKKLKASYII